MNAHFTRIPTNPEADEIDRPEWNISPSKCDWQVMFYGGDNPRTGFPQRPLEFQFFGPHYSRRQIVERAVDMAEREHRLFFQIREPSEPRFLRARTSLVREALS
jgi:hypothetical protein